ncbi:hypothetical protein AMECASPLE_001471 [Ameca splendens]|uniref:Uncharacterized protein n=1 Tax=Ameca splendens TaxID=208324 RepID=A0ABV0YK03_9TELE
MHAPQTNELRPPGAARQYSRPHDAPPRPPPCPRERRQPSKQKSGTESTARTERVSLPPPTPRDAEPPTSMPAKQKRMSQAKLGFLPSQRHGNTTHPSIHR